MPFPPPNPRQSTDHLHEYWSIQNQMQWLASVDKHERTRIIVYDSIEDAVRRHPTLENGDYEAYALPEGVEDRHGNRLITFPNAKVITVPREFVNEDLFRASGAQLDLEAYIIGHNILRSGQEIGVILRPPNVCQSSTDIEVVGSNDPMGLIATYNPQSKVRGGPSLDPSKKY